MFLNIPTHNNQRICICFKHTQNIYKKNNKVCQKEWKEVIIRVENNEKGEKTR